MLQTRDAIIEGNLIRNTNNAAIFVCSTDGAAIRNNRIEGSSTRPDRSVGRSTIVLRNSRNIEITGNTLTPGRGQTRAVSIGPGCDKVTIKTHGNKGF